MRITPYTKTIVKCTLCKGIGCSLCRGKHKIPGLKEHTYYQIDGVEYSNVDDSSNDSVDNGRLTEKAS